MLGMQQPWRNTGCRLATCRCCCWMRGPKCWGCNSLGATQAAGWQPAGVAAGCEAQNAGNATALAQHRLQVGNLQVLLLDARPKMLGMQQPWRNTGCRLATCRCCCWMRGPKCWECNSLGATCRLATCSCCWMRGPKCWGCMLDARPKMLGMQQPWRNTGCRLATCRCCCWMRGPKCWGCNSLGATQAAGWQPAGVAAGCEAQKAGDATALAQHRLQVGNLQVLLLDARPKMLGMQQPWRNTGCRLATCRCCCWMRGPKCCRCNSLGATQAAGWQPAGVAAGCKAQNAGDATTLAQHRLQVGNLQVLLLDARPKMLGMQQPWPNTGCRLATCRCCCWMRGPKCWGCNSLGATQAAGWQPAGVAAGCKAQNAGDATALAQHRLQVGNLQVLLLDARPKMLGCNNLGATQAAGWQPAGVAAGCEAQNAGDATATQAAGWQPAGVAAGCEAQNAGDATALAQHRLQVGNLQVLLLDARPKMLGMQQPWRNTGCRLATCRCCCWMQGPKCWRCNSLGATQAAGWQPAGVAAGCEAQNAGDATALAQHRLQVGNLQVLLLDARPKMLGMQQPWRNTGCRLATCRCCCWMRGPKCWGCNSLGATQAAGWQPAGKMLGMQQPWPNTGCRLATCRCCCWMRGPKCWGCNSLGATQAAGWQPAGVAAGCEAQNAGDATALAQHRLQVGNLQVLLLDARPKMLGCNNLGATQAAGWQPAGVAAGCEA